MIKNLVIVESPAKAKTLEKFLGKDFNVKSSNGHIRDLDKKNLGIDIENNFTPQYIISPEKKKIVTELRKAVKESETIWLASDEDREGEAISWHLSEVLKLKPKDRKRIVFHEITKNAILKAIENPRDIDENLVNAQQARRILDRLVGFEISPVLWRKVKPSLSAGRVQSVAVRLIVDREREILDFNPVSSFKVTGKFKTSKDNTEFKADLDQRLGTKKDTLKLLNACKNATFKVSQVTKKPSKRNPAAPFTTSTLQQEASRKLGYPVAKTMSVAQRLYENGLITYMRTDSTNLSTEAINRAKDIINSLHGEKYSKPRNYTTKVKGAQEAHEAIRPSYIDKESIDGSYDEQKLYSLIWKRTIASQMKEAEFEKTTATIDISTTSEKFIASGEVLKFDGFLKVYFESSDDEKEKSPFEDTLLPPLKNGQELFPAAIDAVQKFSHHPPRYTEASLVKKLEELGIGRPSTYAPIISTIQQRDYVIKESREGFQRNYTHIILKDNNIKEHTKTEITGAEKSKLFPTDIGMVVNDFLVKYFPKVLNFNFTANVEKEFDIIAEGKLDWNKMIDKFYKPFHKNVEATLELSKKDVGERKLGNHPKTGKPVVAKIGRYGPIVQMGESNMKEEKPKFASLRKDQLMEKITLEEAIELLDHANEGRKLGKHPESGRNVYARIGKYGPLVQIGENDDEEKKFASLKKGQTIETITLEEALELFKLPRTVGKYEDKDVVAAIGRFGPYLRHNSKFYSLKKQDDPISIDINRAIEVIEQKRESDRKRLIKEFEGKSDLKIIKDRWGHPSIYYKKKYHRIPSKTDPLSLSYDDCKKLVGDTSSKNNKKAKKKSTKK
jgi:DNA topoisomerase I